LIATQAAGFIRIMEKSPASFRSRVKAVEPVKIGANPQPTETIFCDCSDKIAGNGSGVERIVAKDAKVVAVVAVQAIHGAEPQKAFAVLVDRANQTLGKTIADGDMFKAGVGNNG